jgi:hypothetical protein
MAIEYFASNKNHSLKTQNEELWHQGRQVVEREYELILVKSAEMGITDSVVFDTKTQSFDDIIEAVDSHFKSEITVKNILVKGKR